MGAVANRPKLTGLLANDKKIWKCIFFIVDLQRNSRNRDTRDL